MRCCLNLEVWQRTTCLNVIWWSLIFCPHVQCLHVCTWDLPPKTLPGVCLEIRSVMRKSHVYHPVKDSATVLLTFTSSWILSIFFPSLHNFSEVFTVLVDMGWGKKKKKKTAHTLLHLTRESWLWCFPTSLQLKKKNYNPSRCMLALAEEERSLVVHDLANERTRNIHFKSTDIPLEPV